MKENRTVMNAISWTKCSMLLDQEALQYLLLQLPQSHLKTPWQPTFSPNKPKTRRGTYSCQQLKIVLWFWLQPQKCLSLHCAVHGAVMEVVKRLLEEPTHSSLSLPLTGCTPSRTQHVRHWVTRCILASHGEQSLIATNGHAAEQKDGTELFETLFGH